MSNRAVWASSGVSDYQFISHRATGLGSNPHHCRQGSARPRVGFSMVRSGVPASGMGATVPDLAIPRPGMGMVKSQQHTEGNVFIKTYQLPAEVAGKIKQGYLVKLKQYDYVKDVDKLEEAAYHLLADCLPDEVQLGLRRLLVDKDFPPAIALKGLPLEDNVPPALHKPPITREDHLVEAVMLGLGRFWGHCTHFEGIALTGVFSEYIASQKGLSTAWRLGMHRDFPFADQDKVPEIRMITGIRQDKERLVKTFISSNRNVYERLTRDEIHLLRTHAVTVRAGDITFPSWHVIQGPEDDPTIALFTPYEGLPPDYTAEGSTPEVSAAYWRANELATDLAQWTKIEAGMCLIFNNLRATHARMPAPVEADGMGRWIKNTMASTKVTPAQRLLPKSWMAPGGVPSQ